MEQGLEYHQLHRGGRTGWWRALLGVALQGVFFVLLLPAVVAIPFAAWLGAHGRSSGQITDFFSLDPVTPGNLAYLNLALAGAIPVTMLVTFLCHGRLRPGWIASVAGRLRWRWLAVCLGLSFLALLATLLVSALLPSTGDTGEVSGHLNDLTSTTRDFALVILVLTPLQAMGEEYLFRGYLTQAVGGLVHGRWAAVGVPALLFALAHGSQSLPVFIDRLSFGLVAGVLVIVTGGLEAGIAMHVLNNFLAFGLALLFGDMTSALNATGGSWWMLPTTLTQSLVYLALATYAARRVGIARRTASEATVLVARRAPM